MHKIYFRLQNEAGEGGDQGSGDDFNQATATPEEIAARLTVSEGSYVAPIKKEDEPTETPEQKLERETKEAAAKSTQTYVASPIWDVLKSDEGFTMPEGLTAENEQELIKPFLAKKFGFDQPQELHPLAKQIQDMAIAKPDLTINDIVNTVSEQFVDVSKMTADAKICFDLIARYGEYDAEKNPDGYTKEDIDEYIAKLTKVEKNEMAKTIEQNINEYNKKLTDDYTKQNQERYEQQYETEVKSIKESVSKLKIDLSKTESIFGIPVNQDELGVWLQEFERVVTPDKATGHRGFDDILSNDISFFKTFVLLAKNGEEKVMEMMTKGRETTKEEIFKKLGITPNFAGGHEREYTDHKNVDYEAAGKLLSQPQMPTT